METLNLTPLYDQAWAIFDTRPFWDIPNDDYMLFMKLANRLVDCYVSQHAAKHYREQNMMNVAWAYGTLDDTSWKEAMAIYKDLIGRGYSWPPSWQWKML